VAGNFFGWIYEPELATWPMCGPRTSAWGRPVSCGSSAGNLNYTFNELVTVRRRDLHAAPVPAPPRATSPTARPRRSPDRRRVLSASYTTGIWAQRSIVEGLDYNVMFGNNLSQFGIDAGQLSNQLEHRVGRPRLDAHVRRVRQGRRFGDYERTRRRHQVWPSLTPRAARTARASRGTEAYRHVQLRCPMGTSSSPTDLFGPGVHDRRGNLPQTSVDAGLKYRGSR